jgi:hypothetical protein
MIGCVEGQMPFDRPHRRRFIALLRRCGGSATGLGAQQLAMQVIGFISAQSISSSAGTFTQV